MTDINSILRLGKVIKLIDSKNGSWEFGISSLVKERQIICDLLLDPIDVPTVEEDADFKVAISYGSGVYLVPVSIEREFEDGGRFKFFLTEEYEFVQRREYYRLVDPELEISCKIYDEVYDARALDLAGGGIGLFMERDRIIKKDTLLELKITFSEGNAVQVAARASHVVPADEPNKYFVGAYFSKIARSDEAKIMKYIFCEQIRRSKAPQQQA